MNLQEKLHDMFSSLDSLGLILRLALYSMGDPICEAEILTWAMVKNYLIEHKPSVWATWPELWRQMQLDRYQAAQNDFHLNHFFEDEDFVLKFSSHDDTRLYFSLVSCLLGRPLKPSLEIYDLHFTIPYADYASILQMQSEKNQQEIAVTDKYIKTVRADENDFWSKLIKDLTQTPDNRTKNFYRRKIHAAYYYASADGIFKANPQDKQKIQRFSQQQIEQKGFLSSPQSVSLITKNKKAKYFGFGSMRAEKLVGICVEARESIANRFMLYDGGTVNALWRNSNFHQMMPLSKLHSATLYSDFAQFKQTVETDIKHTYNEVLARISFNEESSCMLIFSNNFPSRCLAQERARSLKIELKKRALGNNIPWDENYEVPILFYPDFEVYTKEQQVEDKKTAQQIFDNADQLEQHLAEWLKDANAQNEELKLDLDFLYLIEDVGAIWQNSKILKALVLEDNQTILYNLFCKSVIADIEFDLENVVCPILLGYMNKHNLLEKLPEFFKIMSKKDFQIRMVMLNFALNFPEILSAYFDFRKVKFDSLHRLEKALLYVCGYKANSAVILVNECYDLLTDHIIHEMLSCTPEILARIFQCLFKTRFEERVLAHVSKYDEKRLRTFLNHIDLTSLAQILDSHCFHDKPVVPIFTTLITEDNFQDIEPFLEDAKFLEILKSAHQQELEIYEFLLQSKRFNIQMGLELMKYLSEEDKELEDKYFFECITRNMDDFLLAKVNGSYLISLPEYASLYKFYVTKLIDKRLLIDKKSLEFILKYASREVFGELHEFSPQFNQALFAEILGDLEETYLNYPINSVIMLLHATDKYFDLQFYENLRLRLCANYNNVQDYINEDYLYLLNFSQAIYVTDFLTRILKLQLNEKETSVLFEGLSFHQFLELLENKPIEEFTFSVKTFFKLLQRLEEPMKFDYAMKALNYYAKNDPNFVNCLNARFLKEEYLLTAKQRISIAPSIYQFLDSQEQKKLLDSLIARYRFQPDQLYTLMKNGIPGYATDGAGKSIAYYYVIDCLGKKPIQIAADAPNLFDLTKVQEDGKTLFDQIRESICTETFSLFMKSISRSFWQVNEDFINNEISRYLSKLETYTSDIRIQLSILLEYTDSYKIEVIPQYCQDPYNIYSLMSLDDTKISPKLIMLLVPLIFQTCYQDRFSVFCYRLKQSDKYLDLPKDSKIAWAYAILESYINHKQELNKQKPYTHWYSRVWGEAIQTEIQAAKALQAYLKGEPLEMFRSFSQGKLSVIVKHMQAQHLLDAKLQPNARLKIV